MRKLALLTLLIPSLVWATASINANRGATSDPKGSTSTSNTTLLLDYSADSQFTYTGSAIVFSGGSAMLKNQFTSDLVLSATFASSIAADYSRDGGSLTVTQSGSPSIASGKLVLTSGNSYVTFSNIKNCPMLSTSTIRALITPNYTGAPGTAQYFVFISANKTDDTNRIIFAHNTGDSKMYMQGQELGGNSFNQSSTWSPTSGQEYEIEYDQDWVAGNHRVFIDGVKLNEQTAKTGTRNFACGLFRLGDIYDGATGSNNANFKIRNVEVFDAVQHTANYTPGYTVPATKYLTTNPVITQTTGVAITTLVGISGGVTVSGSDTATFCLYNGTTNYYYSSGWTTNAACDSTHSSSLSLMNTNAATLTAGTYQVKAVLHSADGTTTPSVSSVSLVYN